MATQSSQSSAGCILYVLLLPNRSKASFYNFSGHPSYLEGLLKLRLLSFKTRVSESIGLDGSWEFSLLKCSQVVVVLLVWGPHSENR